MPWFLTVLFSLIIVIIHLWIAPIIPLGVDEAHYALYGKHLALSYFDHPPMVGWLQAIVVYFSNTELALRIIPTGLFFFVGLTLHSLTKQLYPNNSKYAPFIAVLLLYSSVLVHLVSFSMIPEVPLLLFGLLVIKLTHHIAKKNQLKHWVLLGMVLGLSALSKYTAIVLVVPIVILLLKKILDIRFYLMVLLAGLLVLPIIIWNYQHDWISFLYQINHGIEAKSWDISLFLKSQLIQLVVFSPIIFITGLMASFWAIKNKQYRWILVWFFPQFLFFAWASGTNDALPHWTMLVWTSILPLVAIYLPQLWQKKSGKIFIILSSIYSLITIVIFYFLLLDKIPINFTTHPMKDLIGWDKAAKQGDKLLTQLKKQYKKPNANLLVNNWSEASRIAWYAYPTPVVVLDNRFDQFDIWYGGLERSGLLITTKKNNSCQLIDKMNAFSPVQKQIVNIFYFYWCDVENANK
ncbi:hypothetical protein MNB_SUP05-5-1081 [hydrothermal vent metagenome]|uniref:Glycosyltransferase RgtA/B/C/D-like domain-containing protein n=1 Tax=hydrothermal vent metagenome TaxID=652676 RepID=A0A1W1CHM9_9ZZZZ